jgi:Fur family transcriptional regulator, peroxide stress response regulator
MPAQTAYNSSMGAKQSTTGKKSRLDAGAIAARVRHFTEICRQRGLKMTPQRLEIFRELAATAEHPSVETVFARIRTRLPNVSLDTVYRTLATLQEHSIIARVEVLDDRARYDANLTRHHHFVCVRCQKVEDVVWPELDTMPLPADARGWGNIDRVHAEIRGVCRACREEADS